ncbi:hypothetical protein L7F22_029522, partial [Adiantum nelumboides]|nr:hypothetical protein [Adiantum nelumboides]
GSATLFPLRPDGCSSPGKTFPHGYMSPIPLGLNMFKNPRPNVLHASGGGTGNFHLSPGHSLTQTRVQFSPPSFAEAIRGPAGKFANPLFNADEGMNPHLEYQSQGWDNDTLFPPGNTQKLNQGAFSPTDKAYGEHEKEEMQHVPPKGPEKEEEGETMPSTHHEEDGEEPHMEQFVRELELMDQKKKAEL